MFDSGFWVKHTCGINKGNPIVSESSSSSIDRSIATDWGSVLSAMGNPASFPIIPVENYLALVAFTQSRVKVNRTIGQKLCELPKCWLPVPLDIVKWPSNRVPSLFWLAVPPPQARSSSGSPKQIQSLDSFSSVPADFRTLMMRIILAQLKVWLSAIRATFTLKAYPFERAALFRMDRHITLDICLI